MCSCYCRKTKCTAVYIRSKNVSLYETHLKQRLVSGKNNALTSLKWLNNEAIPIDEFTKNLDTNYGFLLN